MSATVAALAAEFFRRRRRPFPAYGWVGVLLLCAAEWLMFQGMDPVATYFTPIAWTAYLLIADAAVLAMRGHSRLHDEPMRFAQTAALSVPLWMIFEGYNLHLANWTYVGLPASLPARWLGYAWSFATIFPAIFVTADLMECFGWWEKPAAPVRFSEGTRRGFVAAGAILLAVPLILPRSIAAYLFAFVWVGFIFLLDPINQRLGLRSIEGDWEAGRRGRLYSLLSAGWVCGWLWEFWNFWAAAQWHYIFPMFQGMKIFEMPAPGYLGFPPFAVECFAMHEFAAWLLGRRKPVSDPGGSPARGPRTVGALRSTARMSGAAARTAILAAVGIAVLCWPGRAQGSELQLPPEVHEGLDLLYNGRPDLAIPKFQGIETANPQSPLGYILEANARWWEIYCETCGIRWNMIDAWPQAPRAADDGYLALTDKITRLAQAKIAEKDSAEMELYEGLGWLLRARLLALRNDRRGTARAGVNARTRLLRCLQLDPDMYDAYLGLGIYNYYVDTLSAIAKILRFFMGIPGGSKQQGMQQLRLAMDKGELTNVEARFYLAKNLRIFELDYAESIEVMKPLVDKYPDNALFYLAIGDSEGKLGHKEAATADFRRAEQLPAYAEACGERVRQVAEQAIGLLGSESASASR